MKDAPFAMRDVPGKGKGLVATRPIPKGELVLEESPLFIQHQPVSNTTILAALSMLSDADQRTFFSLANAWRGALPPPLGVFKTNCLPCGDHMRSRGVNAETAAIFPLGSRINSSCTPNLNNYWDTDRGQITFWSMRNIAEGEELCICYTDPLVCRQDRRAELEKAFRFVCRCDACAKEGEELRVSDERRTTIARLYDEIAGCGNKPSVGVRKVKLALELLAEESSGDTSQTASFSTIHGIDLPGTGVADVRNAKAWVKKAREAYCTVRGPQSTDARRMAKYFEDPRAHPAFGLLPKMTLVGLQPFFR